MAATINAAVYGSGVYGTALYGQVIISDPDQATATGSVNSVSVNVKEKISGVSATGAVTAVAINGFEIDVSEALNSVSATGSVSAVSVNVIEKIAGVSSTITTGTPNVFSVNRISISGVSATSSVGTVTVNVDEKVDAVSATAYAGSLTLHTTAGITSVGLTASAGTLIPHFSDTVSLTGVHAFGLLNGVSFGQFEIDVVEKLELQGILVSSSVGSIRSNIAFPLASVEATINTGTIGTTAVVFDFEAVKENYSRERTAYIARVI